MAGGFKQNTRNKSIAGFPSILNRILKHILIRKVYPGITLTFMVNAVNEIYITVFATDARSSGI